MLNAFINAMGQASAEYMTTAGGMAGKATAEIKKNVAKNTMSKIKIVTV